MKMNDVAGRPPCLQSRRGGRHRASGSDGASLCPCRCDPHKKRRQRLRMMPALIVLIAAVGQAFAFRHVRPSDDDARPERRGGAFLRSLARVAERGASKWGEYASSTKKKRTKSALQKSSSLYISKLHRQIREVQSSDGLGGGAVDGDLERKMTLLDEGNAPPEHLVQEILAYMLGGAVAGSAFAAATAGAFIGTAVIAVGAVTTVLFTSEEEEELYLMSDDDIASDEDVSDSEQVVESESCDYNGDEEQQVDIKASSVPTKDKLLARKKLDRYVLRELERCYHGNPQRASVDFAWRYPNDICLVGGHDEGASSSGVHDIIAKSKEELLSENVDTHGESSEEEPEMKLTDAIEDVCSSSQQCDDIIPTIREDAPKRVKVVWHDAFDNAEHPHYYTQTRASEAERHSKRSQRRSALAKSRMDRRDKEQSVDDHWAVLTDAERDGALLLSESFRVASSAFGLVADAVRFGGETAAATAGGAARIAGGAVRLSGWAVGSLGEAIEKGGEGQGRASETDKTRKRQVAGKSVRLIGDAIEQVADSLLLAGSATERVAFAAAGAAEGTVRIVEDFASSLSEMFRLSSVSSNSHLPRAEQKLFEEKDIDEELDIVKEEAPSAPEDAAMSVKERDNDTEIATFVSKEAHSNDEALAKLYRWASTWVEQNTDAITADTVGVPSIAPEMLGVLLLCFLASVLLLSPEKRPLRTEGVPRVVHGEHRNIDDHDTHSTISDHSTVKADPDGRRVGPPSASSLQIMAGPLVFLFSLPMKLARTVLVCSFRIVISKKTFLLVIYLLGWMFVSRVSQHRNILIQRKSELIGFRSAIQSIGQSPEPTAESAVWLNALLYRLWRIREGGLEPLLSSSASASLAETLARPYTKPSVVAHVALKAFTFGSSPPFISRLVVDGVDEDRSAVYLTLDVGMLLQDAALLLDISPSSLEYKSLPTTQVSVNSIFIPKATLGVSIQCSPAYPYITYANVSLVEIPDVSLRIEPLKESGLKGVDFGSLPVVSQWINTSINAALAQYLVPQYISIDMSAWLGGEDRIVTYFGG